MSEIPSQPIIMRRTEEQLGQPVPQEIRDHNVGVSPPPEIDLGPAEPDREPATLTEAEEVAIAEAETGAPGSSGLTAPEGPRSPGEALRAADEVTQPSSEPPSISEGSLSLRDRIARASEELEPVAEPVSEPELEDALAELEPDELEALRAEFPDEAEAPADEVSIPVQLIVETVQLVEQLAGDVDEFKSDVAREFAQLEARVGEGGTGELIARIARLEAMIANLVTHIQRATGVTVKL